MLTLLGQSGLLLPVTPSLIIAIGALILAGWLIFSLIIRYHWKNYGTSGIEIFSMNFFYIIGSLVIGGLMVISGLLYIISAQ